MKAIIADIHGNLEALQAVLQDIAAQNVRDIYCLGDVVGFGPNPRECVDLVTDCTVALMGDHDLAAVSGPTPASLTFARSTAWTRRQLETPDLAASRRRREFLAGLPQTHREGDFLFLHGGPRDPVNEYLFPEDIHNARKVRDVFAAVDRYCLMGHTHIPGIITEDPQFTPPEQMDGRWLLDGRKTLCNVGSVGQPRDGDARACYVLLDGNVVYFRRVEYDFDKTVEKIKGIDGFPRG